MELFGRWNEVLMNIDVPQVRSVRGRCISVINTCLATKGKSKLKKKRNPAREYQRSLSKDDRHSRTKFTISILVKIANA